MASASTASLALFYLFWLAVSRVSRSLGASAFKSSIAWSHRRAERRATGNDLAEHLTLRLSWTKKEGEFSMGCTATDVMKEMRVTKVSVSQCVIACPSTGPNGRDLAHVARSPGPLLGLAEFFDICARIHMLYQAPVRRPASFVSQLADFPLAEGRVTATSSLLVELTASLKEVTNGCPSNNSSEPLTARSSLNRA